MIDPLPITVDVLLHHLKQTFGSQTCLTSCSVLTGGARKKVFRLELSHPQQAIVLLAWQNEHDYFGERDNNASSRSDHQAPFLYKANTEKLLQNGVKVPALYYFDSSYQDVPFCYALVEYLQGRTFNEWRTDHTPQEIQTLLNRVREYLGKMHSVQRDTYGTLLDDAPKLVPCHEQVRVEALSQLSGLASAFDVVLQNKELVERTLMKLYERVASRNRYNFIHDELGPDEHLLIDKDDHIAIIDVDGCQFWDLEREYAYLKLRFGEYYKLLERDDLDEARMRFYGLCLHISAAYGHYQLFRQGFPDPDMLKAIFEWNIQQVICYPV